MKSVLGAIAICLSASIAHAWSPLVEATEAPGIIADEAPVILDIRSPSAYAAGHVEGAVNVPYNAWRGPEASPGALIDDAKLSLILSEAGVEPDVPVVVTYEGRGTLDFGSAARVYWTLKSAGVQRIAILNGGVRAWVAAGHPLDMAEGANFPSDLAFSFDPALQTGRQALARILKTGGPVTLLDARPATFFEGRKTHERAAAAGTLPGAKNLVHAVWFDGARLSVTPAGVMDELAKHQIDPSLPIVNFCNTGHWAATNWFVLSEIAGIATATLYPESWVGWTQADGKVAAK